MLEGAGRADRYSGQQRRRPAPQTDGLERDDFIKAIDANMLTAVALMQALVPA